MESSEMETCGQCGFDGGEWNNRDTINTLAHLADFAALATDGAPEDLLHRRPDSTTWSIAEYVDHMREIVFGNHLLMRVAGETPSTDLGDIPEKAMAAESAVDLAAAHAGLRNEVVAVWDWLRQLPEDQWARWAMAGGERRSISRTARHIIHDCFHHYDDMARIRHQLGDAVAMNGSLAQISASGGGVPKLAVDHGRVDRGGLVGDTQQARQHHGRPWQALCLYSAEAIADLQRQGHPIQPGSVGENLTLSGVDWSAMRSGLTVTVGDMVCRLSSPAVPCSKNNQWFADNSSSHLDHNRHPGFARWYARVLTPGTIAAGDPIAVTSAIVG